MWQIFKKSSSNTKKTLHFLMGQKNEHPITDANLKECHLYHLYHQKGEDTMRKAREFLTALVLEQVRGGCIEAYLADKKMKDKEMFKKYVGMFLEELEEGVIRKRLPREKIGELTRL